MSFTNHISGSHRINAASPPIFSKWLGLLIIILSISQQAYSQKIQISSGAHLVMKGRPFLIINNAALSNDGVITADSSTVKFSGTADSSIVYVDGSSSNQFYNLTISKTANAIALRSTVAIKDSLNITEGILYSNDKLVLLSDTTQTAQLTQLPVDGSGNATAYVTGKASIERYLPALRAWRLLSAPALTTNAPSINSSWQEGVTTASGNPNPNPGYGVHIIGGSVADGYDQGLTSSSSIKIYNNSNNSFTGLPAGGTNLPISNYGGYFLFVKGNRSLDITQLNSTPIPATLRMKVGVKTGQQQISVNSLGYTLFGNPYPSAINFETITKNNVRNLFYTWDPAMDGTYGVGAWVTVSWNGSSYDATASVSEVSQCIPSGAAVFVRADDTLQVASMVVQESDKTNCMGFASLNRGETISGKLRTSLFTKNTNGSNTLIDGILTTFDDMYLNSIDVFDAEKMASKYISQKREGKLFSIERRRSIVENDTIFLQLSQVPQRNYSMQFVFEGMAGQPIEAILKDNFSATLNNTILNLGDTNLIEFDVNSNPASAAADRFMIVFAQQKVLPLAFTKVKAAAQTNGILVEWETEQEVNIKDYVVEKSLNGTLFYPIGEQLAKGNGSVGTNRYQYLDEAAVTGNQFYRIKARETSSSTRLSNTVLVKIDKSNNGFVVFPNPVIAHTIRLQTNAKAMGSYNYRLFSSSGQVLAKGSFNIMQPNQQVQLSVATSIPSGVYELEIQQPSQSSVFQKIIIQ